MEFSPNASAKSFGRLISRVFCEKWGFFPRRTCDPAFTRNEIPTKIAPVHQTTRREPVMNRAPFLTATLLAVAIFTVPAQAQDASKKAAVKPADSPSQAVLASWNDIGRKLTAMAEDFPEDKYDFKPTPAQRSFAEQLLHAAGANYFFTDPVTGQKPPSGDPKRDQYKTKADVAAFVKKAFADG